MFAYGPTHTTASPNPINSCLISIQTGFTFLVLVYPGCPRKKAVKPVYCSSVVVFPLLSLSLSRAPDQSGSQSVFKCSQIYAMASNLLEVFLFEEADGLVDVETVSKLHVLRALHLLNAPVVAGRV